MFYPLHPRGSWAIRLLAAAAIAALIALASACSNSEPSGDPAADSPSAISHSAQVDERNGQIVFVSVALSAPARVAVEYENEFAGKFRTALSETAAEHIIPVVRLRADAVYQYAVGVEKADGEFAYQARGEFTTGALPGVLATMRSKSSGESSQDLILSDYKAIPSDGGRIRHIVMMDALGRIVWNYEGGEDPLASVVLQRVHVQPNGDIMYMNKNNRIRRITPLGSAVDEIAIPPDKDLPHHDFLPLEDGRILYAGRYALHFNDSANGGDAETKAMIDTINLYDPAADEIERVWDPMDFWDMRDPSQRAEGWGEDAPDADWLHMNSLSKSADGGYILSLRNIHQVVSLSSDFKTVRWRLGGPDSDFDFPNPADRFTMQHTATELPNGNILVFDNQAELPEEEGGGNYSRALELRLDFANKTAVKAWEFSPEPRIYSRITSSAYRLDNGNTLVNFGYSEDFSTIPIAIIETDAQGREVFRLETIDPPISGSAPRRFRAYPGPKSIMGETMLRAPKRR